MVIYVKGTVTRSVDNYMCFMALYRHKQILFGYWTAIKCVSLDYAVFIRSPQIPISMADEEDIFCGTVFATPIDNP